MDKLRASHNMFKRTLMEKYIKRSMKVLDVGCGRGGDIHKWNKIGCSVFGIDPDRDAIQEARARILESGYTNVSASCMSILDIDDMYDAVCYNFSLQYIFKSNDEFLKTTEKIKSIVKPGGLFIGIVPDASKILSLPIKWTDDYGNTIERGPGIGKVEQCGNMILVNLVDGPYYSKGPIPEPLCYIDFLTDELSEEFDLIYIGNMSPTNKNIISKIYTSFVFSRRV
jgi:SAM-dependent methyltransferase